MRTVDNSNAPWRLKTLWRSLVIGRLYLLHWITGRRLELFFISEPDLISFTGSYVTFSWQVNGCHQITINDAIVLPGNAGFIRFDPGQLSGALQLCFHGYRKTLVKTYSLTPLNLPLKQLSRTLVQQPELHDHELHLHWEPPLPASLIKIQLPTATPPIGLRLRTEFYTASVCRSIAGVKLEICHLPQLNP